LYEARKNFRPGNSNLGRQHLTLEFAVRRPWDVKLVTAKPSPNRHFFCSGDVAPETGIYCVFHGEHRLSHEVTVLKGNLFPVCSKCTNQVHFELVRAVPLAYTDSEFRVVLNSLPVFEEDEERRRKRVS
jgi:hypothetical protein